METFEDCITICRMMKLKNTWMGAKGFRFVNCGQPLLNIADKRPLTICDYYTVSKSDLKAADNVDCMNQQLFYCLFLASNIGSGVASP